MSNYYKLDKLPLIFDVETARDNLGGEESSLVTMLNMGLEMFLPNKQIEQILDLYKNTKWDVVGSPEYHKFENLAHQTKGVCRYLALDRLQYYLGHLQYQIRDGKIIQVAATIDLVLDCCEPTQHAIQSYLQMPINIIHFEPVSIYSYKKDNTRKEIYPVKEQYYDHVEEQPESKMICNIF